MTSQGRDGRRDADLLRRAAAEAIGTAFLLAAIVGSGIMGQRLAGGNAALALLVNSVATGAALLALITTLQPVSAHLNPVVTLVALLLGETRWRVGWLLVAAQFTGAMLGVLAAHAMFSEPWISASAHDRGGLAQAFSEGIATFGLIAVIIACARRRPTVVPLAVSAYIVAAYWFTASTSFANPAVTVARSLTGTFAGIRGVDVGPFIVAQILGATAAAAVLGWLVPDSPAEHV